MRRLLFSALFCLFAAITTQADPFVILPNGELGFNTSFTTNGTFNCTLCTGSGTNSVVFGSGGNTVQLTFTGVNTTMVVSGASQPVTLGQIQVVASGSGFVFPTPSNPNFPLVTLSLGISQTSPSVGGTGINLIAFGGGTSLNFLPFNTNWGSIPIGPNPASFTFIVFTFQNFTIPNTNATVPVTADVSAVPEPASVLLLTSGAGLLFSFRKRFLKH